MTNIAINYSKLDSKLNMQVGMASSRADFNNASFEIFIRTHNPIGPGLYRDQNNNPIPGVSVRGTEDSTIQTATVTGAALGPLSNDPNVKRLAGSSQLRPV